ncbi:MAG: DUF1963 domain-containing protein [Saprospiraceae bacterium]|nr:DUF1963 domain-containing protein [Saprospiraceae bacterium]MCB9326882.1 DUF1963 domain-containing protein [Lewinellaceae bacterium]
MILLEIQNIQKFKPTKWASKDLSGLSEGQTYVRFVGNHPNNPEYGSVVLSTKILEGSFDKINRVLFIGDEAQEGRLLNWKKQIFGGYKIEIKLDAIFRHRLKYSAQNFIQKRGAIVGLSEHEKDSLNSINGQKKLLSLLAAYIIPVKKNEILKFARPGYLCIPNDDTDESVSHFLGSPKHGATEITNEKGYKFLHLATMKLNDFPKDGTTEKLNNVLSFYLRTQETEKGWPERKNDFKIFNDANVKHPINSSEPGNANNFDIINLLDLPRYDHSLLHVLNFSEEERNRYDVLRSVYMQLLLGDKTDHEVNKLFGFPDSVQNCVSYEAERVFNQRDYSDDIYKDAVNWTLLLQVSPYCKWFGFFDEFGDGSIYYMIKHEDLENGNFENCQVIVQNT